MKKFQSGNVMVQLIGAIVLVLGLIFGIYALSCYQKVPAGHVGVHVYLLGGQKGVDNIVRPVGRHWIGWQQELYLYPTFTQTVRWQANSEGSPVPGVTFSDIDGTSINADIGMSYRVDPTKAAALFQEFRKPIEDITNGQILQAVTTALNNEASKLKVDQIYGAGRQALLQRVEDSVRQEFLKRGILIERLSWLGPPRLPKPVNDALIAKIEATQKTLQRENEVAQIKAEAEKAREEAKGVADAQLTKARAEAEAIRIKGDALRQNQELVQLTLVEKWDGKLPDQYLGGGDKEGVILQLMQK